jgi:hypothetical protein
MILDTTTRKLQIVLTGAKTTLDMPVVVDWVDNTTTTFTPGVTPTTTNGVGLVDILAAPAGTTQRKVNGLTINNIDTAAKTVQVFLNDNGTSYQIQSQVLQIGDILCYTDAHGWYTKDSNGNIKGFGATGATGNTGNTGAGGATGLNGLIGMDGSDGEDVWPIPATFQIAPIITAGPAFSAYLPTTNQSISSGILTKVALSAKEFDTTTAYDSVTNYRFTPLVAGYYQVNAGVSISGAIGTASSIIIYKNGSAFKEGAGSTASATAVQLDAGAIIFLNGSSDYIELFCSYTGTTPVIIFGSNNTYFQASLLPGIAGAAGGVAVSTGTIIDFAGTSAPSGYLACPTTLTNISRVTYAALFAAIGTTWGVGDGSTTFGLPWFAADYAAVQANANVGTSSVGVLLTHTHATNSGVSSGGGGTIASGSVLGLTSATASTMTPSGTTANLAAGVRVLKCIKY